jgi:hypothetical protein
MLSANPIHPEPEKNPSFSQNLYFEIIGFGSWDD